MCAHFTHDWQNQHPPICTNANWPCNCLQFKGHIFILNAFPPPWLANISKPHLCVAVSTGQANLVHSRAVAECIQCWSCRRCEAPASLHTCWVFFLQCQWRRGAAHTTWLYSLFTFLNLLPLEQYKGAPHIFHVLDKPLLGHCHSNWDQCWIQSTPHTTKQGRCMFQC